jgi:hypothetical protein
MRVYITHQPPLVTVGDATGDVHRLPSTFTTNFWEASSPNVRAVGYPGVASPMMVRAEVLARIQAVTVMVLEIPE